jgi:antitoxin component of MazEF toxin-antitoxin module
VSVLEIKTTIIKAGNSYVMRIPKALVDCKILEKGKEYIIHVANNPSNNSPVVKSQLHLSEYMDGGSNLNICAFT